MYANILTLLCLFEYFTFTHGLQCPDEINPKKSVFHTIESYQNVSFSLITKNVSSQGNYITLEVGHIENLYSGIFNRFDADLIMQLMLRVNNIQTIDDGAFNGLTCLHNLYLSRNNISRITNRTFSNLPFLKILELFDNNLKEIPDNTFAFNPYVNHLDLSHNKITTLNNYTFYGLKNMEILDLSHNQLTNVDPETFRFTENLRFLHLESNKLTSFQIEELNFTNLNHLNLAGNSLQRFDFNRTFPYVTSLKSLNIARNKFRRLNPFQLIKAFPHLTALHLNGNPWLCHNLMHTISILKESGVNCKDHNSSINLRDIDCVDLLDSDEKHKRDEAALVQGISFVKCVTSCLIILGVAYVVWYLITNHKIRGYCRNLQFLRNQDNREDDNEHCLL